MPEMETALSFGAPLSSSSRRRFLSPLRSSIYCIAKTQRLKRTRRVQNRQNNGVVIGKSSGSASMVSDPSPVSQQYFRERISKLIDCKKVSFKNPGIAMKPDWKLMD
nr:hypothetical protein Iba_chr02aCG22660 [Ipomoea batatas]